MVEQLRLVLFYGQVPALKGLAIYFILASIFAWGTYIFFQRLRPRFADMV
jgi:lipopolysaccharide transport system permease protein